MEGKAGGAASVVLELVDSSVVGVIGNAVAYHPMTVSVGLQRRWRASI